MTSSAHPIFSGSGRAFGLWQLSDGTKNQPENRKVVRVGISGRNASAKVVEQFSKKARGLLIPPMGSIFHGITHLPLEQFKASAPEKIRERLAMECELKEGGEKSQWVTDFILLGTEHHQGASMARIFYIFARRESISPLYEAHPHAEGMVSALVALLPLAHTVAASQEADDPGHLLVLVPVPKGRPAAGGQKDPSGSRDYMVAVYLFENGRFWNFSEYHVAMGTTDPSGQDGIRDLIRRLELLTSGQSEGASRWRMATDDSRLFDALNALHPIERFGFASQKSGQKPGFDHSGLDEAHVPPPFDSAPPEIWPAVGAGIIAANRATYSLYEQVKPDHGYPCLEWENKVRRRTRGLQKRMEISFFCLFLLVVLGVSGMVWHQRTSATAQLRQKEKETRVLTLERDLSEASARYAQLRRLISVPRQFELEAGLSWNQVLNTITSQMPRPVFLEQLDVRRNEKAGSVRFKILAMGSVSGNLDTKQSRAIVTQVKTSLEKLLDKGLFLDLSFRERLGDDVLRVDRSNGGNQVSAGFEFTAVVNSNVAFAP